MITSIRDINRAHRLFFLANITTFVMCIFTQKLIAASSIVFLFMVGNKQDITSILCYRIHKLNRTRPSIGFMAGITFGDEVDPLHLAVVGEHLADVRRVHVGRHAAEVDHPALAEAVLQRPLPLLPLHVFLLAFASLASFLLITDQVFLFFGVVLVLGGLRHGRGREAG